MRSFGKIWKPRKVFLVDNIKEKINALFNELKKSARINKAIPKCAMPVKGGKIDPRRVFIDEFGKGLTKAKRKFLDDYMQAYPKDTIDDIINALDEISDYFKDSYTRINTALRKGGKADDEIKSIIKGMKTFKNNTKGNTVYRGMRLPVRQFDKFKDIIVDKGFMSTSKNLKTAEEFTVSSGIGKKVIFKLVDKRGLGKVVPKGLTKWSGEQEILFPPGTHIEIVNVFIERGITIIEGIIL